MHTEENYEQKSSYPEIIPYNNQRENQQKGKIGFEGVNYEGFKLADIVIQQNFSNIESQEVDGYNWCTTKN